MPDQQPSRQDSLKAPGDSPRDYPICAHCGRRMTVRQLTPTLGAPDADEVVYGCGDCGTAALRIVKRWRVHDRG